MKSSPLKVYFSKPEHGWLTVTIRNADAKIELDASDVPNNSLNDLLSALVILLQSKKGEQRVDWNLEPDYYHLTLTREVEEFSIRIEDGRNEILKFHGDRSSVIFPFADKLLKFESANYSESHWPILDANRISKLKELLNS